MKRRLLYAVMVCAAAAGCQKTEQMAGGMREFTATIEQTKTTFNSGKVAWETGDEISINDGMNTSLFVVSQLDNGVATFALKEGERELSASSSTYTACYPSYLGTSGLQPLTVNSSGKETSLLPMGAVSPNAKLVFRNLCALVRCEVSSDAEGLGLRSLGISSEKALTGPFRIVDGAAVMTSDGASSAAVSCSGQDGFPMGKTPLVLYLAVPEGKYSTFTFEATASNGVRKVFPLKSDNLTLERNKIYTKKIELRDLDVTDFREEGPSNCYIANGKGKYRFAAVRPDGSPLGEIASVGLIWIYNNSATAPQEGSIVKSISYADGVVDFQTDGTLGNALIGAFDAAGTVLWSWHIWCPSEMPKDVVCPGATLMDRYLGALSANPSDGVQCVGFMYQWGRKDPFPGRVTDGNTIGGFTGTEYEEIPGPVEMQTAIANPTKRYYATDSNFWTTSDSRSLADWGGSGKSIQDPCPRGYRVPQYDMFGSTAKADIQAMFTWNSSQYGFSYKNGQSWYPATGQLAPKGVNLNSGTSISFSWTRTINASGNPYLLDLRSGGVNGYSGGAAAAGFAVRCEKTSN